MLPLLFSLVILYFLPPVVPQDNVTSLVGTWSSKSNSVFTGLSFYDPVREELKEPRLTGSSYSFTDDGYYEEAVYLAISNRGAPSNRAPSILFLATSVRANDSHNPAPSLAVTPSCTKGVMQWQHGRYFIADNGSLVLHPIAIDGRQLYSDPCEYSNSIYTRFNTTEVFRRWEIVVDGYSGLTRLNLFRFDGAPMNPMYLAYTPPLILPTQTLHPTTGMRSKPTGPPKAMKKRAFPVTYDGTGNANVDNWWWIGIGLTSVGLTGLFLV